MWRFAADNPSTLSCMMCRARPTAWKPRSALSEGFFLALWLGSIRIRSTGGIFGFSRLAGVFAEVLAGRAMGMRITFPSRFIEKHIQWNMHTVESNKLMVKLLFCTHTYISTAVYFCCLFVDLFINFTTKTFHKKNKIWCRKCKSWLWTYES